MKAFSATRLPSTIKLKSISFYSSWNGELVNFTQLHEKDIQIIAFGYLQQSDESNIRRVVAVIEEHKRFPLETRSMIWRIAEIDIERQTGWLIFSRSQKDLSSEALTDFVLDSKNYLKHLRDEHKHEELKAE